MKVDADGACAGGAEVMLGAVMHLPQLKHLTCEGNLDGSEVGDKLVKLSEHASGLQTLQLIDIMATFRSSKACGYDWVGFLGGFANLTHLSLTLHLKDVDAIVKSVSSMPLLKVLDLTYNKFTVFSCNRLLKMLSTREGTGEFGPIHKIDLQNSVLSRRKSRRRGADMLFRKSWPGLYRRQLMVFEKDACEGA